MAREELSIDVPHAACPSVSARLDAPDAPTAGPERSAILLAHGAGAPMTSEFLEAVATGLAARGFAVLRFQYAYAERAEREGRRRPPDRRSVLLDVHRAAVAHARERFGERRLLLAGKSMGGRMASLLAAEGVDAAGLVFLGYPLHPAGKRGAPRSEHFPAIALPALFVQGTRDALCDLQLLAPALETFGGSARLTAIEGADHDFRVPRALGRSRGAILAEIVDAVDGWERATFP